MRPLRAPRRAVPRGSLHISPTLRGSTPRAWTRMACRCPGCRRNGTSSSFCDRRLGACFQLCFFGCAVYSRCASIVGSRASLIRHQCHRYRRRYKYSDTATGVRRQDRHLKKPIIGCFIAVSRRRGSCTTTSAPPHSEATYRPTHSASTVSYRLLQRKRKPMCHEPRAQGSLSHFISI